MSRQNFGQRKRLISAHQYQAVFRAPSRSSDQVLTVLARRNDLEHPRLGLAIQKKILKRAVARNRVKRIVRESFRHHQSLLDGLDVVVIGRQGLKRTDNRQLFNALERHWSRLAKQCARC